jgi:homogentisate 1,2-dioxygenase
MAVGELAKKHHVQLRDAAGALRYEECFTRDGFDGPYTIAYHLRRPHTHSIAEPHHGWRPAAQHASDRDRPLAKRHYQTPLLTSGGTALDDRTILLFNDDVQAGVAFPTADDPVYAADGDADTLVYIHRGGGVLRSLFGDVTFAAGDYVFVPRGLLHRFTLAGNLTQHWFTLALAGGLHFPRQFRNEAGQLRMDAPYSHRDFKRPEFRGPLDEGIRTIAVKRQDRWHAFTLADSPLDVVGWDGTVYPWAFPILNFQPRVSSVHLPPTWHGTFAARGALVCSFVPRLVDFHPDAIPCPYPHSSTHCDEIIFYCEGNFTSRKGVSPGSISHHPMGVPHGPHPGSYEKSIGATRTDELAVMADAFGALQATPAALGIEDPGYQDSFL